MFTGLILKIIFLLFLISRVSYPQTADGIVGQAGDRTISVNEFQERYEFTPGFKREKSKDGESLKLQFLYTLLAEKLWALEASSLRMDTLEVMKFSKLAFEKMFVRDELYRKEIFGKIKIDESELRDGYLKFNTTLYVNYLISEDQEEIYQLYNLLIQGVPFDSILAESPELLEQRKPVKIVFGQMEEHVEDSLFNLKIGEYTSPIFTPDGWYIFFLKNRSEQLVTVTDISLDTKKSVEKIIKARREKEIFWQFRRNLLKDKNVKVDPVLFESLAKSLSFVLSEKQFRESIKIGDPVYMLSKEVIKIENMLGEDSLKMNFILFEDKPVSLKEFIRTLAFNGFNSTDCDIIYLRGVLDSKTREIIEQELIYREGLKQNLNQLPEVRQQVGMWYDNYLFQVLQEKFLDSASVTDQELKAYYSSVHKEEEYPTLINLLIITSDKRESVESLIPLLDDEDSIVQLKVKNSENLTDNINIVETGLVPVMNLGKIGEIANYMELSDIHGPEEIESKFVVFKLLEKVDSRTIPPVPVEKVGDYLKRDLLKAKLKLKMENYTASLALKYGMRLNLKLLDSIEVTRISSFGIRYLGFGGKMSSVPLLAPNYDWINKYFESINNVQP